jgi:hypothetical protein
METATYDPNDLLAGDLAAQIETVTLAAGANYARGSVLGRVSVGAAGAAVADGGNTGNGTISAISAGAKAKAGTYIIRFTGATTYNVFNPDGLMLPPGTAAGAYPQAPAVNPEINFTFTAGGTPMVAGDSFTIAVAAGSGEYKLAAAAAVDGSQVPTAVLAAGCDATSGAKPAPAFFVGEFNDAKLAYGAGHDMGSVNAAFRAEAAALFVRKLV